MKLNLGCRDKPLPTYINIDINPDNKYADVIDNAFELNTIKDNSCDLIEAVHMMEHLSFEEVNIALKVWYNKLKTSGILRLAVPDAEKGAALLTLLGRDAVKSIFCGSQQNEWEFHKSIHTKQSLTQDLTKVGFSFIQEWEWQKTWPHSYCDSYAQSYWPPMQKKFECSNGKTIDLGGILLSLNLEAIK